MKVISIGMFTPGNAPVVWRGPMLHRALQQFLADVYWGDLDVLLLDLPPGTGDIAISVAQLVPNAEILVVTTPQQAAAEVAERAGAIAVQTHQKIVGVVENMAGLPCPHCDEMVDVFGTGGGQSVADGLTRTTGATVPVLGSIPIDVRLREGGDDGRPVVLTDPDSPAGAALRAIAGKLGGTAAGPVGHVPGDHPAEQVLTDVARLLPLGARGTARQATTAQHPPHNPTPHSEGAPQPTAPHSHAYTPISLITAKPSPYALIPRPYAPTCTPSCVDPASTQPNSDSR